jgi:hypothetical protein
MNGYNGWANWETWQVNLWIDNEEPWYRAKQRFLRSIAGDNLADTVDKVQSFCLEVFPDGTPDMDPEEDSMSKVDWEELTEAFLAEAEEYL